jgi:hypothetical protein
MPIQVHVDEARGLLEIVVAGELTDSEFVETGKRYLLEPFASLPLGLFDLSDVTGISVAAESVREIVRRVALHVDSRLVEGKLAIVASTDLSFGMARMYGMLRDDSPVEVRVFRKRDEAESWLGLEKQL